MDGGGRVPEPLTAGSPGGRQGRVVFGHEAEAPLTRPSAPRRFRAGRVLALGLPFGFRRRRSVSVPLARRIPALAGTWLTLGFFGAIGAYGLTLNGEAASFRASYGDLRDIAARSVGLGVERITISGLSTLDEREVLATAGISPRSSLPFLGAAELRDRLEHAPLVKSAEVRKVYPGEISITLVERQPFAIWQKDGELFVVAADGAVIDRLRDPRLAELPLVVGEKANLRAGDYAALLAAAGPVRSKIRAGMLVSGRRWTLKMQNGLDVRLPETGAVAAMTRLVRLDREQGLLDKDVLAVDLRLPDRVVVRLTEEAAAARAETLKKKPLRGVKGIET